MGYNTRAATRYTSEPVARPKARRKVSSIDSPTKPRSDASVIAAAPPPSGCGGGVAKLEFVGGVDDFDASDACDQRSLRVIVSSTRMKMAVRADCFGSDGLNGRDTAMNTPCCAHRVREMRDAALARREPVVPGADARISSVNADATDRTGMSSPDSIAACGAEL